MIVELGVGLVGMGALAYAIHWYRGRVKRARIREERVEKLKQLKAKLKREKLLKRLNWLKRKIEGGK